jgi:type IV secretory pathway TraG/TraD family ATPase VirD4
MHMTAWIHKHAWLLPATALPLIGLALLITQRATQDLFRRGARVEARAALRALWRRTLGRGPGRALRVCGQGLAPLDETKHFKLIGSTGTGKSTVIRELLSGALARGDRAIIADPDRGYLTRFYDRGRGDVVLNPFEPTSVRWDPFAELQDAFDVEQLIWSLVPTSPDASGQEWRGYARTFLTALTRRLWERGDRDSAQLWRLLAVAPAEELRPLLAGTPAQPFLDPDNARMFGSIRAVTGSAAAALQYILAQGGPPFSVREWVRAGRGVLFVPYSARQIAALRTIIATWMRLAIFEAMSAGEGDLRLWFIVDELDALGAIDGLKDALARLRKFGGRCVLGFQSVSQVSGIYGADAQAIVENCGNTLILRCSSSENGGTAQFASRLIGEREVVRRQTARGRDRDGLFGAGALRRSTNVSEQRLTEWAVMPSEIEQLPDLRGYLKLASRPYWLRVALSP